MGPWFSAGKQQHYHKWRSLSSERRTQGRLRPRPAGLAWESLTDKLEEAAVEMEASACRTRRMDGYINILVSADQSSVYVCTKIHLFCHSQLPPIYMRAHIHAAMQNQYVFQQAAAVA